MNITDLFKNVASWFTDTVVKKRVQNDESGYGWISKALGFTQTPNRENIQQFFDRSDLNDEYVQKFNETQNRKPVAGIQAEIDMLYSFHKCFAMRHHSRLQYYRKDLSQKGARTLSTMNLALGKFKYKRDLLDQ